MYDELVAELSEQIAIVTAQEASLEDLNRLIARSKAYWDWPEEYLSRAIPLHRITPPYLRSNRCFELVTKHGELLGFLLITEGNGRVVIDNLWIEPEHIGRGIGSRQCTSRLSWHVHVDGRTCGFSQIRRLRGSTERLAFATPASESRLV